jgi:hypothetical protein
VAELRPPRLSWGQASCAATPCRAQSWGRADHGRVSRHGRAQGRAGAAAGTPRWASRGPLAGTPRRAAPAGRARGRRGRGSGRARSAPRPGCRAAMAERQRPGRGSGRRTKPGKRAGEPRAATPRHPSRRARHGEERRGKGTGRREQDGLTVGEGTCGRRRFSCSRAMEEEGASGERFAREREKNASSWERGDEQGATTETYRRAPRGGRRQLGNCSARTRVTEAGKPLGGWAASRPAGLWAARGKKTGGRLGRASRRVGGVRGAQEKRGGARWAAGGECRPKGERGKEEGKKKGSFSHFNHFSKSMISQIQSTKKRYAGTGMVQQSK